MQQEPDAEALVLRLRADLTDTRQAQDDFYWLESRLREHLAVILRMLMEAGEVPLAAKLTRAARRAQRRNKRHEAHP